MGFEQSVRACDTVCIHCGGGSWLFRPHEGPLPSVELLCCWDPCVHGYHCSGSRLNVSLFQGDLLVLPNSLPANSDDSQSGNADTLWPPGCLWMLTCPANSSVICMFLVPGRPSFIRANGSYGSCAKHAARGFFSRKSQDEAKRDFSL